VPHAYRLIVPFLVLLCLKCALLIRLHVYKNELLYFNERRGLVAA
jgi:hypothetical protein